MQIDSANPTPEKKSATLLSALDSLLAAAEAFKNLRAILLLGMTFICAVVVGFAMNFIASKGGGMLFSALGALLAFVILFYGASAVGIMLMHEAHGDARNDIMDAVMQSLSTSHRLIGVAILAFLIMLAAYMVVAIVLAICKIPFLGPVLFTVAFPVSAIFLGVLMFSLFYILMPLAGPAVWSGSTTFQAIARLVSIAKNKLISVILHQFILFVIVMFVAMIIFFMVIMGLVIAGSMSAGIVGFGGGMSFRDPFSSGFDGYVVAGLIGGGVLYAVAAVIPALIATKGMCIIYLNAVDGLDFEHAEAQLQSGMAAVKKKAEEARERAQQMAEQPTRQSPDNAIQPASPSASPASTAAVPETAPMAAAAMAAAVSPASPVAASQTSVAAPLRTAPAAVPPAAVSPAAPAAPVDRASPTPQVAPSASVQAPAAPPARPVAANCPSCHVPVASDDAFCGNCGHKLK
ncbi:hypothetical protein BH11PSE11_BH11PSE11_25750 [soil metagenome]